MAGRTLVTPPALEPVTVADMDSYARVTTTTEDALMTTLITAARRACEDFAGQSFITQTWDLFYDFFPRWMDGYTLDGAFTPIGASSWGGYPAAFGRRELPIILSRGPVQSVTSVKYTPYNAAQLTLDPATYQVDVANTRAARVNPNFDRLWPTDVLQSINGVVVRIVAGYGSTAASVPENITLVIKQLAAYWFYNRDAVGTVPDGVAEQLNGVTAVPTYA